VQDTLDKTQNQNAYIGTANNTEIARIGWGGLYRTGNAIQIRLT
jgi:hypothetical protein